MRLGDGRGRRVAFGTLLLRGGPRRLLGMALGRLPLRDALSGRLRRTILDGRLPFGGTMRRALAWLRPPRVALVLPALPGELLRLPTVGPPAARIVPVPHAADVVDGHAVVDDARVRVDVVDGGGRLVRQVGLDSIGPGRGRSARRLAICGRLAVCGCGRRRADRF